MKRLRNILPEIVVMGASYPAILVSAVVSVCLDEWAVAGGGFNVPDRWLYVPAAIFVAVSFVQAILFFARKGRAGYGQVALSALKFVAVFAVESVIDFILDPVWQGMSGTDQAYLAMVILFCVALVAAAVSEIVGNLRLRRTMGE